MKWFATAVLITLALLLVIVAIQGYFIRQLLNEPKVVVLGIVPSPEISLDLGPAFMEETPIQNPGLWLPPDPWKGEVGSALGVYPGYRLLPDGTVLYWDTTLNDTVVIAPGTI